MTTKSDYEESNRLVSREELIKNVSKMMGELNEIDFHHMYSIIWALTAKDLIIKCNKGK